MRWHHPLILLLWTLAAWAHFMVWEGQWFIWWILLSLFPERITLHQWSQIVLVKYSTPIFCYSWSSNPILLNLFPQVDLRKLKFIKTNLSAHWVIDHFLNHFLATLIFTYFGQGKHIWLARLSFSGDLTLMYSS
jgi:hypothetical protein